MGISRAGKQLRLTDRRVTGQTVTRPHNLHAKVLRVGVRRGAAHLEDSKTLMMQSPTVEQLGVSQSNQLEL